MLRVLPDLRRVPVSDKTVYAGGPLAIGINALVRSRVRPGDAKRTSGDIWLVSDQSAIAAAVSRDPRAVRVFIGQCGWSVQQMEAEIARRLWVVSLADADIVFDARPETLWRRLSERLTK